MGIKNFRVFASAFLDGRQCFQSWSVPQACADSIDFHACWFRAEAEKLGLPFDRTTELPLQSRCGVYMDLSSYTYGHMMKAVGDVPCDRFIKGENKTVVYEMDQSTIERVVKTCTDAVLRTVGDLMTRAHSLYFAYDTFQPSGKRFEQDRRKDKARFYLSKKSRTSCYRGIVEALYVATVDLHKRRLSQERRVDALQDLLPLASTAATTQFGDTPQPFSVGEGEMKCFYRIFGDLQSDSTQVCYVFGRDWDIGLGTIVYHTPERPTAIRYVTSPDECFRIAKPITVFQKMMCFMTLSLFGNDFIPGLVNLGARNTKVMSREWDLIFNTSAVHTNRAVSDLKKLFDDDQTASDSADVGLRRSMTTAFALITYRLLMAVYGKEGTPSVETILSFATSTDPTDFREYIKCRRVECSAIAENTKPDDYKTLDKSTADEGSLVVCKDSEGSRVLRTFQQCVDSYAASLLWYTSYFMFFRKSSTSRRLFTEASTNHSDIPLYIGLGLGDRTLKYNAEVSKSFEISSLLDIKRIVRGFDACNLYWTIESAFANVLLYDV